MWNLRTEREREREQKKEEEKESGGIGFRIVLLDGSLYFAAV